MVKAKANMEEIPGIVVGGNVTKSAQISGDPMADGEEAAKVIDEELTYGNGNTYQVVNGKGKDSNGVNGSAEKSGPTLHDKLEAVKKHIEEGHLFNVVAKGFKDA